MNNIFKKFTTLLGGVDEVRVILRNDPANRDLCAVYSAESGHKIGQMPYKSAIAKFKHVVVDNFKEATPVSDYFTLSDIQDEIKRKTDVTVSSTNISRLIREYNNFQMPLGKRVEKIATDESERTKFVEYVKQRLS